MGPPVMDGYELADRIRERAILRMLRAAPVPLVLTR